MERQSMGSERTPIKDPAFLDRLEQLAREADRVRRLTDDLIALILGSEPEPKAAAKQEPSSNTEKEAQRSNHLLELSTSGFLQTFTGRTGATLPKDHASRRRLLELYWNTQRLLIAAQFGGFSLASHAPIRKVMDTLNSDDLFWKYLTAQDTVPPHKFARMFALLSLLSVVHPRRKELSELAANKESEWRGLLLAELVAHVLRFQRDRLAGSLDVPPIAVLKLVRSVDQSSFVGLRDAHRLSEIERGLIKELAILLPSGTAPPDEIAETMRVLGGRYLNPGLHPDPAEIDLYQAAVEYILASRNRDGSWKLSQTKKRLRKSEFLPLTYVLDMPNALLMPSIATLANAAAEALATLTRRLNGFLVRLPGSAYDPDKYAEVNRTIYDGLMISGAVADRLRDLLSDAELDELGADVPTRFVQWSLLPDSLGFVDHVRNGAIELWKDRSEKRPGAILVFGPPGTGKTTIAKSLLQELNTALRNTPGEGIHEDWRFIALSPADFARDGKDHIIASAEKMFRKLQRIRRCVVLLDEMEEFLRIRGEESTQESRLITTAFLPLLQETVNRREIILIVATNFVGTIDPAVTRRGRFDLILPLGPPDGPSRRRIIEEAEKEFAASHPGNPSIDLNRFDNLLDVVTYTMGYTRDELRDYLSELRLINRSATNDALKIELWRIRQERVPMALSGNPGCDWRTFRDEAARFKRGASSPRSPIKTAEKVKEKSGKANEDEEIRKLDYWEEPDMPSLGQSKARPRRRSSP